MMRRLTGVAILATALAAGCGENGPPPGAPMGTPSPVHGTVKLADGTAVRGGIVTFTPVEVEIGSQIRYEGAGLIDAQGRYKAGFGGDGKGLVPGEYKVSVAPREVGELPNSNVKQVPKPFRSSGTTTLKVTVGEKDNTIDVVLK